MDKKSIKQYCLNHLKEKSDVLVHAINEAQASANSNTKSSAGDKHETSRAMAQLENERLKKQLHQLNKLNEALKAIPIEQHTDSIQLGSIAETSAGSFFISIGLGKIMCNNEEFFVVPLHSPVGKQLANKKEGDSFVFNNNQESILKLY